MEPSSGQPPERLGVLGGTFDPIHIGHLVAASEAMYRFGLQQIVLVPTGRPWQKASYSDPEDRMMMATLAAATHSKLAVSRVEIDRKGPTYTVETLEEFRSFFPSTQLYFIAGADAVAELGTWHRVEDLAGLAEVVAVTRPGSDITNLPTSAGWPKVTALEIPGLAISSTDIRRRVAEGLPIDYLVPADVARFIRERGLYVQVEEARGA
ncbi:MAG: nicotinate-nucleotide adenylyltransferase [Actinomycetota bacterium]|jgi:nicotinate-nucleotide adenylyltransferase|nr:nicotinate-nucleotide adenylyltransferase [Actinomycetota bacterium]